MSAGDPSTHIKNDHSEARLVNTARTRQVLGQPELRSETLSQNKSKNEKNKNKKPRKTKNQKSHLCARVLPQCECRNCRSQCFPLPCGSQGSNSGPSLAAGAFTLLSHLTSVPTLFTLGSQLRVSHMLGKDSSTKL